MSPKGTALSILSITPEAPISSQNLNLTSPPFQAGLPTVIGRPWLLQALGRAGNTQAHVAEFSFDVGNPNTFPPGPTGIIYSR